MSSWIKCVCGNLIHTNLFAGGQVYRLIPDEEYERLDDPTAPEAARLLFMSGREVFRCPGCARLVVFWERSGAPAFYLEEPVEKAESPDS